jgi:hypothetical protein
MAMLRQKSYSCQERRQLCFRSLLQRTFPTLPCWESRAMLIARTIKSLLVALVYTCRQPYEAMQKPMTLVRPPAAAPATVALKRVHHVQIWQFGQSRCVMLCYMRVGNSIRGEG